MINLMIIMFSLSLGISTLLILMHLLTESANKELKSTFECGFSPYRNSRDMFSLRFFLLGVLFLLFDMELMILFPLIWMTEGPLFYYFIPLTGFILILSLGLFHEMYQGALEWVKL